jgi:hypothetical protein
MKRISTLRAIAPVAGLAVAMFAGISVAAPEHAAAGYWTTSCNPWGCRQVYVPTCHRVLMGYDPWGRPIFGRACR